MAVLAAAQLLDELMGRNRNINPNEKTQKLNWEDPQYCKYYMVKFCPHDLFVNTRADLGICPRIHDDEVKDLFEHAEPGHKKTFYQDEFLRFCQTMISDVERKIQKGKQRLELMNTKLEMPALTAAQTERNQQQVQALLERVGTLEAEAEQAGIKGDVEKAQGLMKLCDQLKEEREQLQKQYDNSHWSTTVELAQAQEKQMEVCAVCGAFLIVGDAQQRIDDHLMGKQHVGYSRLKEAYDDINKEREKQREEKDRRRKEDRDRRGGGLGSGLGDGSEKDRGRSQRSDKDRGDRDRDRVSRGRRSGAGRDEKRGSRHNDHDRRGKSRGDEGKPRGEEGKPKSDDPRPAREEGKPRGEEGRPRGEEGRPRGEEGRPRGGEEGRPRGEDGRSRGRDDRGLGSRDRSRDRDSRRRRSRSRGR